MHERFDKGETMQLDKSKYNIYLVVAILSAFVIFMGVSTVVVVKDVTSSSSIQLLEDQKK